MRTLALRLQPGEDLLLSLEAVARTHRLMAPIVLTCVGSLSHVVLRMAGISESEERHGDYEIVSLVGTLAPDGPHLHMTASDATGVVVGGHLLAGNIVRTTAEVVLAELEDVSFRRPVDPQTGYDELVVDPRPMDG